MIQTINQLLTIFRTKQRHNWKN